MTTLSLILPEIGKPDHTQDPKIVTALTEIQTWGNGNIGTANLETHLLAGAWEAVTLGAKIEEETALQTIRARSILGGAAVELRGAAKVKAGEELKLTETLLTLPAGLRPPATVEPLSASVGIKIPTTGIATCSVALPSANVLFLDGVHFNLT
jgi:hypothetical protein